jgi:hypothetical protein
MTFSSRAPHATDPLSVAGLPASIRISPADDPQHVPGLLGQFSAYLARGFDCPQLITIAPDRGEQPWGPSPDVDVEHPTESHLHLPQLAGDLLERSIIVLRLSPEDCKDSGPLLAALRTYLDLAPVALLTCEPGNPLPASWDQRGLQDASMPRPTELELFLVQHGLNVSFVGRLARDDADWERQTILGVLENNHRPPRRASPRGFRVVAVMPTYNEDDIVSHSLRYLIEQGIEVYLVDNWSTDATVERATPFLTRGLIQIERFPASGPTGTYDLRNLLSRVEEICTEIEADWFVLHDADERRRSPWPGLSLKDGMYYVDSCGFNCIDHLTVNYWPVDNGFDPSYDVEQQLTHFEFSNHPGHFHQRRAWKNLGRRVSLAQTAGHDVGFEGRKVYPFRFLQKHYPIRSQAHGEHKILGDRKPRWNPEERSFGWHAQYDELGPGHSFLRNPADLEQADEPTFNEKYIVERLSGLGIFREAPPWATPPR